MGPPSLLLDVLFGWGDKPFHQLSLEGSRDEKKRIFEEESSGGLRKKNEYSDGPRRKSGSEWECTISGILKVR